MAAVAAAAAAATMIVPGTAFAIESRECRADVPYLKIWSHFDDLSRTRVDCYAYSGRMNFSWRWVEKISTGNNDVMYFDVNGDSVTIKRWNEISFRKPPQVKAIEILATS